MEMTLRDAITVLHGMFLGALLLLAVSATAMCVYAVSSPSNRWKLSPAQYRFFSVYLACVALLAWVVVLIGAYTIYPWYRAHPSTGTTDLSGFPQRLLISRPSTAGWHDLGMEWKEHIAWFAPITLTVAAYLFSRYGNYLYALRSLRRALLGLIALAFFSASVAGVFGAMLNKFAPIRGGATIVIMREGSDGR